VPACLGCGEETRITGVFADHPDKAFANKGGDWTTRPLQSGKDHRLLNEEGGGLHGKNLVVVMSAVASRRS
jgi:hypothetical protein